MKKLCFAAFLCLIMMNITGEAMAGRLEELTEKFNQLYSAMKADTENKNGYTQRHRMRLMGIRSSLRLADGFDINIPAKREALQTKSDINRRHFQDLGGAQDEASQKSREFFEYKGRQLEQAEAENSAEPLLDLAEREIASFNQAGHTPLTAEELQTWFSIDEGIIILASLAKTPDNLAKLLQ